MEGLFRAGVLSAGEYADLVGAFFFLRRLINALRLLRGNAADLFLPAEGSDELLHLARRMGGDDDAEGDASRQLLEKFERSTARVRDFLEGSFARPCP